VPPLRVVLTGPESTGKTWIASRLARELGLPRSAEAARAVAEEQGRALEAADIDDVARRQIALEERALEQALALGAPLVLHDTDLVSTVVYGRHYNGSCPAWIEREARERRADLYLLLGIDVPFEPEPGLRGTAADREAQLPLFRSALAEIGARVREIGGSWDQRLARVRSEVERRIARSAALRS
jgi:nicotinamide riboside kinase